MQQSKFKKLHIEITTYEKSEGSSNMNEDKNKRISKANLHNRFICSICLNLKEDKGSDTKRNSMSCPICQRTCEMCLEKAQDKAENVFGESEKKKLKEIITKDKSRKNTETKSVQTDQTDLNKSINLLNEVLTVFQSKKLKPVARKDASVSTNDVRKLKSKLSISKMFLFSIAQNKANENGKFVVTSSKTDDWKRSYMNLAHKSSSVPQMKLEELKYKLKEKTKSKDTIEEVNRMFATVRRNYKQDNDLNRPSVRNGPRLLPVVETIADQNKKLLKPEFSHELRCKCCQTSNCMSSGDSLKCCHVKDDDKTDREQSYHKKEVEKCEKCVYMLCCHYKNSKKSQTGIMTCEKCQDEFIWKNPNRSFEDSA